jgi:hypothetical protein
MHNRTLIDREDEDQIYTKQRPYRKENVLWQLLLSAGIIKLSALPQIRWWENLRDGLFVEESDLDLFI